MTSLDTETLYLVAQSDCRLDALASREDHALQAIQEHQAHCHPECSMIIRIANDHSESKDRCIAVSPYILGYSLDRIC